MRRALMGLVALAVILALPRVAEAQCSIQATTAVTFGTYDVFAATPRDAQGSVRYSCFLALTVRITLSRGLSSTYQPRRMGSGTARLDYNLYLNTARTNTWGDGSSGTSFYSVLVGALQTVTVPIYGRIPAHQDVPVGAYSDTVVATLTF